MIPITSMAINKFAIKKARAERRRGRKATVGHKKIYRK